MSSSNQLCPSLTRVPEANKTEARRALAERGQALVWDWGKVGCWMTFWKWPWVNHRNQENLADFEQIYGGYWLLDSLRYVLGTIRDKAVLIDKKIDTVVRMAACATMELPVYVYSLKKHTLTFNVQGKILLLGSPPTCIDSFVPTCDVLYHQVIRDIVKCLHSPPTALSDFFIDCLENVPSKEGLTRHFARDPPFWAHRDPFLLHRKKHVIGGCWQIINGACVEFFFIVSTI